MRDPKLALAIAIHQGAIALMVDHGEGAMDRERAVQKSRQAMVSVVGECREQPGGLDVSLASIEGEFKNGRFYHGETSEERRFMDGLAG